MRYKRATRYALLLTFAFLAPMILTGLIPRVHAASYSIGTIPFITQEGSSITVVFTVSGATGGTLYQFRFFVRDPATKVFQSVLQNYTTALGQTQFTLPPFLYPTSSFLGPNSLVGQYIIWADQVRPVAISTVASTYFFIILTDNTEYQRTETVNIHATGYNGTELVTVKIATATTSTTVFTQTGPASLSGIVVANWKIPRNATIDPNGYVVTLTGTTTVKTPADVQGFNLKPATMSISALNSQRSTYQRTETMSFSFQPVYPDGTIASTGAALVTLSRPDGVNITLTATYSSGSQTFNATYKTSFDNQTGTWKASLAVNAYADAWGNAGPNARLTNTPQLTSATLTIAVTATTYVLIGQQVKFNATISYPDGVQLKAGSVGSYLLYTGTPSVNETVPVVFDTGLQLWVGSYTPKTSDPGGLWSLVVSAADSPTPHNTGSATKAVTLQDRPPTASFTASPSTAPTGTSITFDGTGSYDSDGTITTYSWAFGDTTTGSGSIVGHTFGIAGTYTVTLTVTDNGGLTSSTQSSVTITDRPPVVSFSPSPSTANTGQTITLSITSSDPDGTVSSTRVDWGDLTIDMLSGAATTDTHSYASTGASTSKMFTIAITVTDNSGSTGSASKTVTINDQIPTVAFTPSSTALNTGQNVTLTITATDPDGTIAGKQVNWGDGTIDTLSAGATSGTHSYSSTGSSTSKAFNINVTATDNSGSKGSYASQVTVSDRPPAVMISMTPASASTGQTITVSIVAVDPDGMIGSTKVNWGDGAVDILTGGPPSDTHSYTSTGSTTSKTFDITVTVTDNSGSTTSSLTSTVSISDRPPTVTVNVTPASASTGQTITVSIASTDPDGTIVGKQVNWGDGSIDTLSAVATSDTHGYASTGSASSKTYDITATVTDNSGSTTSSLAFTVNITQSSTQSPSGNLSLPLYYFGILAAAIAALLIGGFFAFRRHRVTHARLKIDLEAVKSEAGRIENQEFFQSVKDQLKKDKE